MEETLEVFSVKLHSWAQRVAEQQTHSELQDNVTANSQRIVEGFLYCSEEMKKKEDLVKCVSTLKFRVFSLVILESHCVFSSTYTSVTVLQVHHALQCQNAVKWPSCTDNIKTISPTS